MRETKNELTAIAKRVLSAAEKLGASQSSASVSRSRFFKVGTRNGMVESLEESSDRGLFLRLFVNGKYAEASTSDLSNQAVDAFVERAFEATRLLHPEPDRALPDSELIEELPAVDLDNFDPAIDKVSKERKMDMALRADKAARAVDEAVFSAQGGFNERRGQQVLLTSEGFEGYQDSTSFYVVGSAAVQDDDHRRRSQWAYQQGVKLSTLDDPESIGTEAARRALSTLGAGPVPTGTYTLVLENRAAPWILRLIRGPLSGQSLHQDRSFLKGKLNKKIAAPKLTITDNPLMKQGLASRLFDGEGIPARTRPIIESGVLKNYYLDTYYARRLDLQPTTGSASNLLISPGTYSAEEIIKGVEKGIFVNSFLGGNSNSLTGDYSAGIGGFLIEDGEIGRPVAEVNVGGKVQDLLMSLAEVGNDPFEYSRSRVPTLKLPGVSVAGT